MRLLEINLKSFLLAVVLSVGGQNQARAEVDLAALAHSSEWRTLLHFRDSASRESEIDEASFFLSRDGRSDPLAELQATIVAFVQPAKVEVGKYRQHPRCAYPARFRFLAAHGFAKELAATEVECPELKNWKRGLGVDAVALVYASPYLGNPASMFGHTFLRLKSRAHPLVDASVSFDASPTADGAIAFALKGLFGGYRGLFSQQPFYVKIETYSAIENRGLWEYELNISEAGIERLVDHLWEMGSASFDYFFFDENCAYQLLSLLEVAEPTWRLREHFSVMTIPLDTVRVVFSTPAAVGKVTFRPSVRANVEARLEQLSTEERAQFELVRMKRRLHGNETTRTLDSLIEWQRYRLANRAEGGDAFDDNLESQILMARSKVSASPSIGLRDPPAPEGGHLSSKVSISALRQNDFNGTSIRVRPALHDRFDGEAGYVPFSTLVIGQFSFSYFDAQKILGVEEVTLAAVENFRPMDELGSAPSWTAAVRLVRPTELGCLDCLAGQVSFGIGASFPIVVKAVQFSALMIARAEISNSFRADYGQLFRFNPSLRAQLFSRFTDEWRFEFAGEYYQPFSRLDREAKGRGEISGTLALAPAAMSFDFRLQLVRALDERSSHDDYRASVGHYF